MNELERGGKVDCLADIMAAEGLEREEGDHRTDSLAARLDHVARDVLEERLFRHDAFPDLRFDEGHFRGHAKIHGKRHPGGPNLCYRLGLFNDLRHTRAASLLRRADPVETAARNLATGENTRALRRATDFVRDLNDRPRRRVSVAVNALDRGTDRVE